MLTGSIPDTISELDSLHVLSLGANGAMSSLNEQGA